jgi:hypothetical protein
MADTTADEPVVGRHFHWFAYVFLPVLLGIGIFVAGLVWGEYGKAHWPAVVEVATYLRESREVFCDDLESIRAKHFPVALAA